MLIKPRTLRGQARSISTALTRVFRGEARDSAQLASAVQEGTADTGTAAGTAITRSRKWRLIRGGGGEAPPLQWHAPSMAGKRNFRTMRWLGTSGDCQTSDMLGVGGETEGGGVAGDWGKVEETVGDRLHRADGRGLGNGNPVVGWAMAESSSSATEDLGKSREQCSSVGIKGYLPDSICTKVWLAPGFDKKVEEFLQSWEIKGLESKELFMRAVVHEQVYNNYLMKLGVGGTSNMSFDDDIIRHWMTAHYAVRGRLELLGDSILSLTVVTDLANSDEDTLSVGDISGLKSEMVSNRTLASFAEEETNIKDLIVAHPWHTCHYSSTAALRNDKANTVERLVGAVYAEKGLEAAIAVVKAKILPWILTYTEKSFGKGQTKHPVNSLEELCKKVYKTNPQYRYIEEGMGLSLKHSVSIFLNGNLLATGHGGSRQQAKRIAAEIALRHQMRDLLRVDVD